MRLKYQEIELILGRDNLRNFIFDLGGVILDIDVNRTRKALADLGGMSPDEIQDNYHTLGFFRKYERGYIDDDEFRDEMRQLLKKDYEDQILNDAWCAMIIDIPQEKVDWVKKVASEYNIYLLSNTNHLHTYTYHKIWEDKTGEPDFSSTFKNVYYSHEIHMRKPDEEIFRKVLDDNNLVPEQTLLIDDTIENIEAAEKIGLKTLHVSQNQSDIEIPG